MAIALTLKDYLDKNCVLYDTVQHRKTGCSAETAEASHVPCDRLAKGVLVKRRGGFLLAVLPASRHIELADLGHWLRQPVGLATEDEIAEIFDDCARGAVPALATPYGVKAVVDQSLSSQPDIYFEGGDHCTLVHLDGRSFDRLMTKVPHARFGW
jgi:Ala-tRNA(Pro) deacylase